MQIGTKKSRRWYVYLPLLLCISILWLGRYLEVCREESPRTSTCVALGDTLNDAFNPRNSTLMSYLLTRLTTLSGAGLRQFAGLRLLVSTGGVVTLLFGHRCLLKRWGSDHLGEGFMGFLLHAMAPVTSVLFACLWLLDILLAVSHSGIPEVFQDFDFLQPEIMLVYHLKYILLIFYIKSG